MSVSFEENFFRLINLKKDAEKFHQTYSKDFINIHHIKNLEEKSIQLKNTYLELQNTRQKSYEDVKTLELQLSGYKQENQRFQEKFNDQNHENELLKNDLKLLEGEINKKNKENQVLHKDLEEKLVRFTKEIENIKLMHSQELFIMKKKEKKSKF